MVLWSDQGAEIMCRANPAFSFMLTILLAQFGCSSSKNVDTAANRFPVEQFRFGDCDLTLTDSACEIEIGGIRAIKLRAKSKDFPSNFGTGTARVMTKSNGKQIMMQSCGFQVEKRDGNLEISCEMEIPQPPCKGVLQIMHGSEIILERAVRIIEKK